MAYSPWAPGGPVARDGVEAAVGEWRKRIDRSRAKAETYYQQWDDALKRYAEAKPGTAKRRINALKEYRHVEGKKSDLFHRTPEVRLITPPKSPLGPAATQRQAFLNFELGPTKANAKRALHQSLLDALAASGWMILKVGFEQVTLPDPMTGAQVPVWSRRFISPVSGKKLRVPAEWHSTQFDEAPWLGVAGVMPLKQAKRMGWTVPEDYEGATIADDAVYGSKIDLGAEPIENACRYTEIWYKASIYDDDVYHPELYRCLILLEGSETPAKWVNSPHQALTEMGELSDDSMLGNPIHVGTLRDLIDSAYVPSDLVVGEQLTNEINTFRTDLIYGRRSRKPLMLVDTDGLDQATVEKIEKNEGPIPVPPGWLAAGKDARVAVITPGSESRDNYTAQDYAERDHDEALGRSSNQAGAFKKSRTTATEVRTVQGNASARAQSEQDRVREFFVSLVRKFDAIVTQTATQAEVVKVLGQEGAALWEQWRMLPGQYGYDILPDAGQYVDATDHRNAALETYNLLRKDERVNVEALLEKVGQALHMDVSTFIAPPSDKTQEPPKATLAVSAPDLNDPVAGRLFLDLLANGGVKLHPDTIRMMAERHQLIQAVAPMAGAMAVGADSDPNMHGGSATVTEPINQHQTERTGGIQGVVQ